MTNLRKAAQMSLDAIETIPEDVEGYLPESITDAAIALRAALAAKEQEPVAIVTGTHGGYFVVTPTNPAMVLPIHMALYTTPPQREWQGLTDEEIIDVTAPIDNRKSGWVLDLSRAIEAKLKEKNND